MQVTVSIKTIEQKFPGGTIGGQWSIELAFASDPSTVAHEYMGASPSASFDLPEGETFVARGSRLDPTDNVLGPVASVQFVVGEDLVPIDVAGTISVVSSISGRAAAPARGKK